jgi:hypothetical protein
MSPAELERFVGQVIAIQAERRAPHLPMTESELFEAINRSFPSELKSRIGELSEKRDADAITETEREELAALTDRLEEHHASRVEALARLARLRGTTLDGIMNLLDIRFPDHG